MAKYETLLAEDGHSLECWLHHCDGTPRGGIVIIQEIFGVTEQLKELAATYAAQGFTVAIPALFDRRKPGTVFDFSEGPKGLEMMKSCSTEEAVKDVRAAAAHLRTIAGRVGAVGFCWGGGLALRAAQTAGLNASVIYYGTRLANHQIDALTCPVLAHFGTNDDHTPADVVEACRTFYPTMETHLYEAGHAFANHHRPVYQDAEAGLAHDRTLAFLAKHLG